MIRVLIVSQVRLVADLIEASLKNEADIQVVGSASQLAEALRQTSACDVVAVSAALPEEGALELTQTLGKTRTAPRVIIIGAAETEPKTLRYLEAGAAGCVQSQDSVADLLRAIRAAARQEIALSPRLAARVVQRVAELAERCRTPNGQVEATPEARMLTSREREVLRLLAQGYHNHEIARQLSIELGTAKNHVHNILDKLKVTSRQEAVACWSLATQQL